MLHFHEIPELEVFLQKTMQTLYLVPKHDVLISLFQKLIRQTEHSYPDSANAPILKVLLTLILLELGALQLPDREVRMVDPAIAACIAYITANIGQVLTVSHIAKKLNFSESALSHLFKSEMNIPLHKYILKKRLILANKKISEGCSAVNAAEECGFREYSNFYRQYKKAFGCAPSMTVAEDDES